MTTIVRAVIAWIKRVVLRMVPAPAERRWNYSEARGETSACKPLVRPINGHVLVSGMACYAQVQSGRYMRHRIVEIDSDGRVLFVRVRRHWKAPSRWCVA